LLRRRLFTLQIAKIARHVIAIDLDPQLIEHRKIRLGESGVTNCTFIESVRLRHSQNIFANRLIIVFLANAFHGVPDQLKTVESCAR
jgi:tRNA/tmRNA/rRNA uracil-C5-methylase (TrmA/RlmC/RlmD family)